MRTRKAKLGVVIVRHVTALSLAASTSEQLQQAWKLLTHEVVHLFLTLYRPESTCSQTRAANHQKVLPAFFRKAQYINAMGMIQNILQGTVMRLGKKHQLLTYFPSNFFFLSQAVNAGGIIKGKFLGQVETNFHGGLREI